MELKRRHDLLVIAVAGIYANIGHRICPKQIAGEIASHRMAVHNKVTAFRRYKGTLTRLLYCSSRYATRMLNRLSCEEVRNWTLLMHLSDANDGSLSFVPDVVDLIIAAFMCNVFRFPPGALMLLESRAAR